MKKQKLLRMAFVLVSVSASAVCQGKSCEDEIKGLLDAQGRPRSIEVYVSKAQACFGTEDDSDPVVVKFSAALKGDQAANLRVRRALGIVVDMAAAAGSPLLPVAAKDEAHLQLKKTVDAVAAAVSPGNSAVSVTAWDLSVGGNLPAVPKLKLDDDLREKCAVGASTTLCSDARKSANAWLRVAALTKLALGEYSQKYLDAVKQLSDRRLKMWHAYRDDALPQFPWEYALNSHFMRRNDTRPIVDGNPQGYETIPTSQYIFLHPGASLEWRDAKQSTSDNHVKPALYVELFGVNHWSYDDSTGEMLGGKGISLMVSYANRKGRTSTGYGLMFHSRMTKQFTLGITRAGGETVYLVNVDLAEYFKKNLSYWKDIQNKIDAGK
jgi:hypothetical protein